MEDWKERLRELSFMKGYYFKLEDNGLVEKKDDQLVFEKEKLEHFIEQEIEKARGGVFTQAERNHLLTLLEERKKDGCYYGNREQYYKRTDRLISKLTTK